MPTAHDRLFQFTFRQTRHAASWLRVALPLAITAAIDWSTLDSANERFPGLRLRSHIADHVYTAQLRDGGGEVVLFVPEHKAFADPELPRQMLRYSVPTQPAK